MNNTRQKRTQRGFTLVELLVVLGIVGVLATLGLQSTSEIREEVFRKTNKTAARDAYTAMMAGQIDLDRLGAEQFSAEWVKGTLRTNSGSLDHTVWAPGAAGMAAGNTRVFLRLNTAVSAADAVNFRYFVVARHCGGKEALMLGETGTGQRLELAYVDPNPC